MATDDQLQAIMAVISELLELTQLSLIFFSGRKSQDRNFSWSQMACPKHMQSSSHQGLIFVQTFQEKVSFEVVKGKDIILQSIGASRNGFHNWKLLVTEEDKEKIKV